MIKYKRKKYHVKKYPISCQPIKKIKIIIQITLNRRVRGFKHRYNRAYGNSKMKSTCCKSTLKNCQQKTAISNYKQRIKKNWKERQGKPDSFKEDNPDN